MQFWILTPSVHVLDIREGFRHIPDYACLNELVSSRVRLDTILRAGKHAFSETLSTTCTETVPVAVTAY